MSKSFPREKVPLTFDPSFFDGGSIRLRSAAKFQSSGNEERFENRRFKAPLIERLVGMIM